MPKFKKGDKVIVRKDTASPYRGQTGTVDRDPLDADSYGFSYLIRFDSKGMKTVHRFNEADLEVPA
jgi:hypothetical protein